MTLRLLVDECLTPKLVAVAKARGHDATHITFLGKAGLSDWNILTLVLQQEFVLVTNNGRDFLQLFDRVELHPGLIVILPQGDRDLQAALFHRALDVAQQAGDLMNRLIEVLPSGEVRIRSWPDPA